MTVVLVIHDCWAVSISFRSFTMVRIAEAITGIEPGPFRVIALARIIMIIGIVNSDVSV